MNLRLVLAFGVAIAVGVFLAVAGSALDWTSETTFVVGVALIGLLSALGTPLILLGPRIARHAERPGHGSTDDVNSPRFGRLAFDQAWMRGVYEHPITLDAGGFRAMTPKSDDLMREFEEAVLTAIQISKTSRARPDEQAVARLAENLMELEVRGARHTAARDVQRVARPPSRANSELNVRSKGIRTAA